MAMKKRPAPQKQPQKNEGAVVYRAGAAMLIACAILLALQVIDEKYRLTASFMAVNTGLLWAAGIFALVAVAGLIGLLGLRKKSVFWRVVSLPGLLLGVALSLSCLLLYYTWYRHIPLLAFACIAVAVLYLIKLLYQPEFFLLSVVNVCAGYVFYRLSKLDVAGALTVRTALWRLFALAVIAVCALLVFLAGRKDGKLTLPGGSWRAISRGGTPLLIYITGAVWTVCLAAGIPLGPVLSYYCVFAGVAFELTAAVYYTMRLA